MRNVDPYQSIKHNHTLLMFHYINEYSYMQNCSEIIYLCKVPACDVF